MRTRRPAPERRTRPFPVDESATYRDTQLATEIPAAIPARTLGIHTDVAVAFQRLSAGARANYAADIARRDRPGPERFAESTRADL